MYKIKFIFLFIISFMLSKCASSQFEKQLPLIINKANYKNVNGGLEGTSTTNITVFVNNIPDNFLVEKFYFQNKITKAYIEKKGANTIIVGRFSLSNGVSKYNLVIDDSPKQKTDTASKKFPFTLKKDEAVLSYFNNKKELKYYKFSSLKKEIDVNMQ